MPGLEVERVLVVPVAAKAPGKIKSSPSCNEIDLDRMPMTRVVRPTGV